MSDYLQAFRQKIETLTGGSLCVPERRPAPVARGKVRHSPVNV
jgi:hypothetical protein